MNVERKTLYVEVVVNAPIHYRRLVSSSPDEPRSSASPWETTFHYAVPPHLQAEVAIGQLVVVPFGASERQGVIVSFSDTAPVSEVREILSISDPKPVLSFPQIELARWLSRTYLSPLPLTVGLMLPPGLTRQAQVVLTLGTRPPEGVRLGEEERLVLDMIERRGSLPFSAIRQSLGEKAAVSLVRRMTKKGYIVKRYQLGGSRVRPKLERLVRLTADESVIQARRLHVGRPSKQADILCLLLESGAAALEADSVMARIGCKEGPLNALRERGLIQVEPQVRLAVDTQKAAAEVIRLRKSERHLAVLNLLLDEPEPVWVGWVYAQTGADLKILQSLEQNGLIQLEEEESLRNPLAGRVFDQRPGPELTGDQQRALEAICRSLDERSGGRFLLHGITGSGKTEVYIRALEAVLGAGRGGIILVPEIALTPQMIERFASRFPGQVAVQHSALSPGERYDQWRQIRARKFPIVVGTRSALFAPVPNLGLIVVDEEHDASYKQDIRPRYHAREAAAKLAELTGATLVLGSATPDVITYTQARRGYYTLLELPQRIITPHDAQQRHTTDSVPRTASNLPSVTIVDMREELKSGNRSIFCRALAAAIEEALQKDEQVILFLNRRGTATFVLCRDCGVVVNCPQCDVPLTYHAYSQSLQCHHCNRRLATPTRCPACGSSRIKYFGIGAEKVAALTAEAFPQARILRWDRDATQAKGAHEAIMTRFVRHEADILVGTQMVTKGLDLPLVTVVGVISADTALYLPDFRTGERTFQLLTQVAGRAGRSDLGGQVYIQTYSPLHYAIQSASRQDYAAFYQQEMAFRRQHGYPPYNRLIRLVYSHQNQDRCRQQAEKLHRELERRIAEMGLVGVSLIGPAPCFLGRVKGKYRWHIVIRARDPQALLLDIHLSPEWEIDVDPLHLL